MSSTERVNRNRLYLALASSFVIALTMSPAVGADHEWRVGTCTRCSVPCGTGTQTCDWVCYVGGLAVDDAFCTRVGLAKPPAEQDCNTDPCVEKLLCCEQADGSGVCLPESQCKNPISSCPAGAGVGTVCQDPPEPVCCTTKDANGQVVSLCVLDRDCTGQIEGDCPAGVALGESCIRTRWVAGSFGDCSMTCGEGTQTRRVECVDDAGNVVSSDRCDASTRPAETRTCTGTDCQWVVRSVL